MPSKKTGETRSYGEKEEAAVNRGRAKAAAQIAEYNRQAKEYENGLKEKKKKHEQWKAVQSGKVQNIFVYICAVVAIWTVIGKIACLINVNAGIAILSPLYEGVMFVAFGAFYGLILSFFVNFGSHFFFPLLRSNVSADKGKHICGDVAYRFFIFFKAAGAFG